MSLKQFKAYLETEEAKKDIVEKAREAGFEVSEEDLAGVAGGSLSEDLQQLIRSKQPGAGSLDKRAGNSENDPAMAGVKL